MRGIESLRRQRDKDDLMCSLGESSFLYQLKFFLITKKRRMRRKEGMREGRKRGGEGREEEEREEKEKESY